VSFCAPDWLLLAFRAPSLSGGAQPPNYLETRCITAYVDFSTAIRRYKLHYTSQLTNADLQRQENYVLRLNASLNYETFLKYFAKHFRVKYITQKISRKFHIVNWSLRKYNSGLELKDFRGVVCLYVELIVFAWYICIYVGVVDSHLLAA
jgi:hypothetical protein